MKTLMLYGLPAIAALMAALAGYTFWQTQKISASFPPAGKFIEANVRGTDTIRLHYTDRKPDAQTSQQQLSLPVILIHGASGNEAEMRTALGAPLRKAGFRVISVDRPGQGWSGRPAGKEDNSPAGQARILRAAMEKIGVRQAIIIAHSLAGAMALQLALDHSDFAKGLVLIAPVTHPWPGGIAAYYSVAASPAGGLFTRTLALPAGQFLMKNAIKSVFAPDIPPPDYLKKTGVELTLRPNAFAANAADVASMYAFVTQQFPRYKNIRVPVAILSGDKDTVVYTDIHSRSSAAAIPGATLEVIKGAGHAPHWIYPEKITQQALKVHDRAMLAKPGNKPVNETNTRPVAGR